MKDKIKVGVLNLWGGLKYFLYESMELSSNRVKLIWFSAFSWAVTHVWFGVVLPLAREISIIYYRQNSIVAAPINLDSPYAQTILNSTDMAFMAIVAGYVASSWKRYSKENPTSNLIEKQIDKEEIKSTVNQEDSDEKQ